jgi:Flp pilus assembly pilin Flp
MLQRFRRFATRLHRDESGPNTVEWILLIVVALILLIAIFWFAKWAYNTFIDKAEKVGEDPFVDDKITDSPGKK